jgi:hypothetical protein
MVTSSLYEISTRISWETVQAGGGGGGSPPAPNFLKAFIQRHLDRYLKDDVNGFSSTLDICFMI